MSEVGSLIGKISMVTGGSGDIGRAIARRLAMSGSTVVVTYEGAEDRAEQTLKEIGDEGGKATKIQLDQRDPGSIEAAVKSIEDQFGQLDILVNNAAWNIGIPFPELEKLTPEIWDRVLETNLRAPFLLARSAASLLGKGEAT